MGLLDKVKASAEQAASSAQKQAQIVATKRELSQAYGDLGKTVFGLVDRGELSHADLATRRRSHPRASGASERRRRKRRR